MIKPENNEAALASAGRPKVNGHRIKTVAAILVKQVIFIF
jgi:hypothetical protein